MFMRLKKTQLIEDIRNDIGKAKTFFPEKLVFDLKTFVFLSWFESYHR